MLCHCERHSGPANAMRKGGGAITIKPADRAPQPEERRASGPRPPGAGNYIHQAPPKGAGSETGQAGGGQGRVDVTGIVPEGIRVDPNLTEGHSGYEESGDSEVIPPECPSAGGATKDKRPAG